ncbi:MAG: nucleotide exchange factor GrpE [Pirellulaceae bacterium]
MNDNNANDELSFEDEHDEAFAGDVRRNSDDVIDVQSFDSVEQLDEGSNPAKAEPSLEQQVAELKNANLKLHADVENVRKRIRREAEDQVRFASLPLINDLLLVFDNLRRALDAAESAGGPSAGLTEGVQMVVKQFEDTLGKYQCKPIKALGEVFDPNVHEAISQMPSENFDAGVVMVEATKGFQLHDRVVRPSQVVVSTGKAS